MPRWRAPPAAAGGAAAAAASSSIPVSALARAPAVQSSRSASRRRVHRRTERRRRRPGPGSGPGRGVGSPTRGDPLRTPERHRARTGAPVSRASAAAPAHQGAHREGVADPGLREDPDRLALARAAVAPAGTPPPAPRGRPARAASASIARQTSGRTQTSLPGHEAHVAAALDRSPLEHHEVEERDVRCAASSTGPVRGRCSSPVRCRTSTPSAPRSPRGRRALASAVDVVSPSRCSEPLS